LGETAGRPKVAIVTPGTFALPSDFSSSVERVVDEISLHLAAEADVYVFSKFRQGLRPTETVNGVTHIRPSAKSPAGYRKAVLGRLRQLHPDLVQVENRPGLVRAVKRAAPRAEVWLSLHSVTFVSPAHISKKRLARELKAARRIVLNSAFLRGELARRFPRMRSKMLINRLGTDPERFRSQWEPGGREAREAFKAGRGLAGRRIVLYAGRLIPIKGVHVLLRCWRKVIRRVPDAVLVVAGSAFYGSGRLTPYVRNLHRLGERTPDAVRFLSYVPYSEMPEWFRAADVAVVPSVGKEAFGLVNVEAMACGVPVVASRVGGIREIVIHGENGFLVSPRELAGRLPELLVRLLSDEPLRRTMGERGAQMVRQSFTWRHTAERQMALYRGYSHIFAGTGGRRRDIRIGYG
jgi:spore coat protein SA